MEAQAQPSPTSIRLRLIFQDGDDGGGGGVLLSKSQKKQGLKRCWVLVKPHFETISDVTAYIIHSFNLFGSCPHGILLSMDGFVLPPFESTAILKDRDLVCVKRKETRLLGGPKVNEGNLIDEEIIKKRPLPSEVMLLANEEFDEETGGYQSDTDVDEDEAEENLLALENSPSDVVSKKRKASGKVERRKAKRQRQGTPQSVRKKQAHDENGRTHKKRECEEAKKVESPAKPKVPVKCTTDQKTASEDESEQNKKETKSAPNVPDKPKKVSRTTKRKQLQRQWKREHMGKEDIDKKSNELRTVEDPHTDSNSKKDMTTNMIDREVADDCSDGEGDLVPVVIRPGHIRFTPLGKVKDIQQNQEGNVSKCTSTSADIGENHAVEKDVWNGHSIKQNGWSSQKDQETILWNGITNKRKGQKWGTEKQSATSWQNSRDRNFQSGGRSANQGHNWSKEKQPINSWDNSRPTTVQSSSKWATQGQNSGNTVVDFEKLVPLIDAPKVGDIIAYRLLELSSSWCPEMSSFRVGKISCFEPESNDITLVPVPEYPFDLLKKVGDDNDADEAPEPPQSSLYEEDGSLKTDFPSLVDVRIVKRVNPSQSKSPATPSLPNGSWKGVNEAGTSKIVDGEQNAIKDVGSKDVSNGQPHTPPPENGKKDVWEEISDALSAKKAELAQKDSWNKKETSSSGTWSRRTLRSNALGPVMARLRSQNGI